MKSRVEIQYNLYIGEKLLESNFQTRHQAIRFGKEHKALCQDCKDKPLRVEKIRAFYETTVSYDESIPELAQ